jgi:hypothetical protein
VGEIRIEKVADMNRFVAEHPMASQPSCFDAKEYPKLSFVYSAFVVALVFTPFIYGFPLYSALTDEVQCTDEPPFPQSWTDFICEVGSVFLLCLICASLFVASYRLLLRHFQKMRHAT